MAPSRTKQKTATKPKRPSSKQATVSNPAPEIKVSNQVSSNPAPRPDPPLAGVVKPVPKRSSKKRRREPDDTGEPSYPVPYEELMKMKTVELRKVAQDNSKGSMSSADEQFFMQFFLEQEQAMIIKAIERQVSISMVNSLLGRRMAIREINRWNRFLKTDKARKIFQTCGQGVRNKEVMKRLSEAYHNLSPEEMAALVQKPDDDDLDEDDESGDGIIGRQPRGPEDLTEEELALDDMSDAEDDAATGPNPLGTRGTVSNLVRKNQVDTVMNRWAKEARNIAKTCCCEIVFFAVSKHLSEHCFRMSRCTPGAFESNQLMSRVDGNEYSARLQGLVTGNSIGEIAVADKLPGKFKKNLVFLRKQVIEELSSLIARQTSNVLTAWPWADNDKQLRDAKFRLELSPGALSEIQWLRQSSKKLKKKHASMVLLDIQNGLINLRPITNPISQISSIAPRTSAGDQNAARNGSGGTGQSGGDQDVEEHDYDDDDDDDDDDEEDEEEEDHNDNNN
ncbi:hypothetical protein PTTG_01745 [Puccinia triticina 1-1 BBBD Race 1]|uniref:Uncharacterized protein n=1 Tax=Puccinia triticina (isolate 1-1 / race 1 (BBBD)) TaxID=630390 RepID=A0A180H230_PUCT1|nr:hypothetical protein PTTG_01745 [Puccinia triticina 1-1 BBBD Race 1]